MAQTLSPMAPPAGSEEMPLETSDRKPRLWGLIIVLVTFGIFGTWATFAPLDGAALAPGVVTVKSYRKTVQHLEGGIVRDILVRDGSVVERGQPLIVLDDTQARAELGVLRGQLFYALATQNRLASERDDLETVLFADELLSAVDLRAVEAMQSEEQIFQARRADRLGEVEVLEQRVAQLESQVDGLEALVSSKEQLARSYDEEVGDLSELLKEGFVDKQRLRELQRNAARTRGEIAEHQASIAEAKVRMGETRLEILQLNKRFMTEVVDQLAEAQASVFDLGERITAVEDRVRRTVIDAPDSGMVMGMATHTIGGVIQPGSPLLDIVPEGDELIVEAQVSPMDIDRVELGMEASIRFSAFRSSTTHVIEGEVTRISADRLTDEQTGMPYYLARVEVTEAGRENLGNLMLIPGMPAEVLIKTGERTLMQYLLQPVSDALARSLIED